MPLRVHRDERELDVFDEFDPFDPPDIPPAEHHALVGLWQNLGGRRWKRGEQWRYSDAREWEGLTVQGGELEVNVPEEIITPTGQRPPGPKLRRGDPKYQKDERVLVQDRCAPLTAGAAVRSLRPARVLVVSIRGFGVKQYVEYDVR